MTTADVLNIIARRKLGASPKWEWFRAMITPSGYLIQGSVPIGVFKSGPRKGQMKWGPRDTADTVIITDEEMKAAKKEMEK